MDRFLRITRIFNGPGVTHKATQPNSPRTNSIPNLLPLPASRGQLPPDPDSPPLAAAPPPRLLTAAPARALGCSSRHGSGRAQALPRPAFSLVPQLLTVAANGQHPPGRPIVRLLLHGRRPRSAAPAFSTAAGTQKSELTHNQDTSKPH